MYQKPTLTRYGSVRELTQIGLGSYGLGWIFGWGRGNGRGHAYAYGHDRS